MYLSSYLCTIFHVFMPVCLLSVLFSLQRSDSKVQNIALLSLYRLVWWVMYINPTHSPFSSTIIIYTHGRVYMVRIRGESNMMTMQRLRLILDTVFPRGQRGVQPKDMPLNIFVKLIQFIARVCHSHSHFGSAEAVYCITCTCTCTCSHTCNCMLAHLYKYGVLWPVNNY